MLQYSGFAMKTLDGIRIEINPAISADQLFSFYEKNDICEKGFGREVAARVLDHSSLIVVAFDGDRLVGIARAMFDGLSACIVEFCLDLEYQGETAYENGSLIEGDRIGLGKKIGDTLIDELRKMGACFISATALEAVEEDFYRSLGMRLNRGSLDYIIDERPYVPAEASEAPDHQP